MILEDVNVCCTCDSHSLEMYPTILDKSFVKNFRDVYAELQHETLKG